MRLSRTTIYAVASAIDTLLAGSTSPVAARLRRVTKPTLMPLLAFAAHGHGRPAGHIDAALASSWIGDIGLLSSANAGFLVGVGGFATAHLNYLRALCVPIPGQRDDPERSIAISVAAGTFAAVTVAAGRVLWKHLSRTDHGLRVPVVAYAGLVSSMGFAAVRRGLLLGGRRGQALIAGGILFTISDGLVAAAKFGPRRYATVEALVMATYTTAQALLVAGLGEQHDSK